MSILRQTFTIRVAHDPAVVALSLGATCGAVICAGIAGGVEAAGGVALIAARLHAACAPGRYDELRFDGDAAWAVAGEGCGVVGVETPGVHVSHPAVVVLEVSERGRSDVLVFTPSATAPEDLRRLRALVRSRRLS